MYVCKTFAFYYIYIWISWIFNFTKLNYICHLTISKDIEVPVSKVDQIIPGLYRSGRADSGPLAGGKV